MYICSIYLYLHAHAHTKIALAQFQNGSKIITKCTAITKRISISRISISQTKYHECGENIFSKWIAFLNTKYSLEKGKIL